MAVAPLERTIVANVKKALERAGWYVIKVHGSAYQQAGLPDLLAWRAGRCLAVECKRPGHRPTKLQQRRLDEMAAAGVDTVVATCVDDVAAWL